MPTDIHSSTSRHFGGTSVCLKRPITVCPMNHHELHHTVGLRKTLSWWQADRVFLELGRKPWEQFQVSDRKHVWRIWSWGSSEQHELAWIASDWLCKIARDCSDAFINRNQPFLGNNDFLMVKGFYTIQFHDPVVSEKLNEQDSLYLQKINNISGVNSIQWSLVDWQLLQCLNFAPQRSVV